LFPQAPSNFQGGLRAPLGNSDERARIISPIIATALAGHMGGTAGVSTTLILLAMITLIATLFVKETKGETFVKTTHTGLSSVTSSSRVTSSSSDGEPMWSAAINPLPQARRSIRAQTLEIFAEVPCHVRGAAIINQAVGKPDLESLKPTTGGSTYLRPQEGVDAYSVRKDVDQSPVRR
jgi:hypothetical protein